MFSVEVISTGARITAGFDIPDILLLVLLQLLGGLQRMKGLVEKRAGIPHSHHVLSSGFEKYWPMCFPKSRKWNASAQIVPI